MNNTTDRELVPEPPNPIGMDGIEFIEFTTSRPQALGGLLEQMGFRPVARHRSREVELYRQGSMNIVVNSQPTDIPRTVMPIERPIISAIAIRVRDADAAFRRALDLGCWEIPPRAQALEQPGALLGQHRAHMPPSSTVPCCCANADTASVNISARCA